jgi:hypothetical protein
MQAKNTEPETQPITANYLVLLRNALALAEQTCLQATTAFQLLQAQIIALHLPMLYWPHSLLRTYRAAFRHHVQAQTEFRRALTFLQTQEAAFIGAKSKSKLAEAGADSEPVPKPRPSEPAQFQQTIIVSVENGKTISQYADFTNEFWLTIPKWPEPSCYTRQICFHEDVVKNKIVPPEYAWTLFNPADPVPDGVFVEYAQDEFYRIFQYEFENACEHAIPGEPSRKTYENFRNRL